MPRKVGYGRPGTRVFPTNWSQTQGRVLDGTYDTSVSIALPGTQTNWDDDLGRTVTTPHDPIYVGPAALMPLGETTPEVTAAEDQVPVRVYQLQLPVATADIEVDMVVAVVGSPDPDLAPVDEDAGPRRFLTVTGIEYGDHRLSRVLTATLNHP